MGKDRGHRIHLASTGSIEDPGGSEDFEYGGWSFEYDRGEDGDKFKMDELKDAEVQLLGRVTYEGFAEAWPLATRATSPTRSTTPQVLVSTTLNDPTWQNTTVISENVPDELAKLRDENDGNILVAGSGRSSRPARERSGRRAAADGLPDDPRQRQAALPRRDRQDQAEPGRGPRRRPGRRPGSDLPARRLGNRAGRSCPLARPSSRR